jgi:hypothetical protein
MKRALVSLVRQRALACSAESAKVDNQLPDILCAR